MAIDLGSVQDFNKKPTSSGTDLGSVGKFDSARGMLSNSQSLLDRYRAEEAVSKEKARVANLPSTIAKETAKSSVNQLLSGPVRAVKSLIAAPVDLARSAMGMGVDKSSTTDFAGNPMQTYQGAIASGKPVLPEVGQAALDVASVLPLGKGVQLAKPLLGKAGGVLSKLASPVTKPIASYLAQRTEKKVVETAFKSATPRTADLSSAEYEQLLRQKRVTPKTTLKPSTYVMSDIEKQTATKYKELLQDKDPVKNSINVMSKIADEDKSVGDFLEQNNSIFNNGELKNSIAEKLKDVSDVVIPEERINKLKSTITDNFVSSLKKNDMKTLWEARKEFDQQIESAFSGSPTLQKEVKKKFRNAVQDFISERTPDGVYKAKMKDMTNLFDLEDTLAMKAAKEKGKAAWQQWLKDNPVKAKVLGYGATAVGGAVLWDIVQ